MHAQRTDDIENYKEHNAAIGKQDESCVRNTGSARRASLTNRAKRYSGTLPRRLLEIPTFLRNLTEYIDIKLSLFYMHFPCLEHRYIFYLKKPRYPT